MVDSQKMKKARGKEILNIIRTTQRNNIELTHIADNKANVLLSLNALMITFLIPLVLANVNMLSELKMGIPLFILIITNLSNIYIATLVLKPGEFGNFKDQNVKEGRKFSPFFFGNFYRMEREEFADYIKNALVEEKDFRMYLVEDLYYIGTRLGRKMTLIKWAFKIFIVGLSSTLLSAGLVLCL